MDTLKEQETLLEALDLSVRTYRCLRRGGIDTLEELLYMTEWQLRSLKNLGPLTFKEIDDKLKELGLSLRTQNYIKVFDFDEHCNEYWYIIDDHGRPESDDDGNVMRFYDDDAGIDELLEQLNCA